MKDPVNEASLWRRELAGDLAAFYSSHPKVLMICLGGSSARGIADQWSDMDIVVYWSEMDVDWIRNGPLPYPRTDLIQHAAGTVIESYHFDGLKVDFGHVRLSDWEDWVKPLRSHTEPDLEMIDSVGGFLSSVVYHGEGEYHRIKKCIATYPDSLALHVVRSNLGFFVKGYLDRQCYRRGDLPAYHDGMLIMLKRLVNITAALNGYWYHAGELRWLRYHIAKMPVRPDGFSWESVVHILEHPGPGSVAMLNGFQDSVLSLVGQRFPEIAEKVEKKRIRIGTLAVRPAYCRPSLSGT